MTARYLLGAAIALMLLPAPAGAAGQVIVDLQWAPISGAAGYALQIAADPHFHNVVRTEQLEGRRFKWSDVPERPHYWRVRGVTAAGQPGRWSHGQPIEGTLKRPVLVGPAKDARVTLANHEVAAQFRAKGSAFVRRMTLEIATDASFEEPTATLPLARGKVRHRFTEAGVYYWRVFGEDLAGNRTPPTSPRRLLVQYPRPKKLRSPAAIDLGNDPKTVTMSWRGPRSARSWHVETEVGGRRQIQTASTSRINLPVTHPGTVRWRVAALPVGQWSTWKTMRVMAARLPAPVVNAPVGPLALHPDAPLEVSWSPVEGARYYQLGWTTESSPPQSVVDTEATTAHLPRPQDGTGTLYVRAMAQAPGEWGSQSIAISGPQLRRLELHGAPVSLVRGEVYRVELRGFDGADLPIAIPAPEFESVGLEVTPSQSPSAVDVRVVAGFTDHAQLSARSGEVQTRHHFRIADTPQGAPAVVAGLRPPVAEQGPEVGGFGVRAGVASNLGSGVSPYVGVAVDLPSGFLPSNLRLAARLGFHRYRQTVPLEGMAPVQASADLLPASANLLYVVAGRDVQWIVGGGVGVQGRLIRVGSAVAGTFAPVFEAVTAAAYGESGSQIMLELSSTVGAARSRLSNAVMFDVRLAMGYRYGR